MGTQNAELMKVPEVAARLRVCTMTIYKHIWKGTLPHVKVGRLTFVPKVAVDAMVQGFGRTRAA